MVYDEYCVLIIDEYNTLQWAYNMISIWYINNNKYS